MEQTQSNYEQMLLNIQVFFVPGVIPGICATLPLVPQGWFRDACVMDWVRV